MTKNTKPTTVEEVLQQLGSKTISFSDAASLIDQIKSADQGGVVARISESGLHLFVKDPSWPLAVKKNGGTYRFSANIPRNVAVKWFGSADTMRKIYSALGIKNPLAA